jgi:AraC-like DNA-binding protein
MLDDPSILRFSTAGLAANERLPVLREVFGRMIVRLDIEAPRDVPVHREVVVRALPGLTVSWIIGSQLRSRRTRELIADGNDDLILCFSQTAGSVVRQVGREFMAAANSAHLLAMSDPFAITTPPVSRTTTVRVPRKVLATTVPNLEDSFAREIPSNSAALGLLKAYLRNLDERQAMTAPGLRSAVVSHVHDLFALALGASRDAAEVAKARGMRAARLHAAKTDILENLTAPGLSIGDIASRHGITPRYLQRLFESEGATFSQFLLEQRLERVHRMLRDPRLAARAISVIALEAGFSDLSHFNRSFRRRFGESPSDVRAAARGARSSPGATTTLFASTRMIQMDQDRVPAPP